MKECEFKVDRTDWNRVFRRWVRTADTRTDAPAALKRQNVPRQVQIVTEEQKEEDARLAVEFMNKLKAVK